jgi:RHS repeat-associated protein
MNGSSALFYTRDHLGSVREAVNSAGALQARSDYDPFVRTILTSGTDVADFGFTGHYYHAPSKLHLAPYRAYDADSGRWLNRDLEEPVVNEFPYAGNNPIVFMDRDGHNPLLFAAAVVVVAAGTAYFIYEATHDFNAAQQARIDANNNALLDPTNVTKHLDEANAAQQAQAAAAIQNAIDTLPNETIHSLNPYVPFCNATQVK